MRVTAFFLGTKADGETAGLIGMFVLGWVLLPVFALWDLRYAKRPVIARRFLKNRTVVCAAWIGFFDFVSSPGAGPACDAGLTIARSCRSS